MKKYGIKASELAKKAGEILGRPVAREGVYANLVASGAEFNEETGRWTLHDDDESETEIDEDALGAATHALLPQP